jgi:hypothetical protein
VTDRQESLAPTIIVPLRHDDWPSVINQPIANFVPTAPQITFDRHELNALLSLYGRKVAEGEWRDYALDFLKDRAVFSVFRRSTEYPLYRIEKNPKLARKQGAYSVVSAAGHILKRGHELARVIAVLEKPVRLVV